MIQMGLLSVNQKDQLIGQYWNEDTTFNPVQDINGNWFISQQEMFGNSNSNFYWVNSLPLEDYYPEPDL